METCNASSECSLFENREWKVPLHSTLLYSCLPVASFPAFLCFFFVFAIFYCDNFPRNRSGKDTAKTIFSPFRKAKGSRENGTEHYISIFDRKRYMQLHRLVAFFGAFSLEDITDMMHCNTKHMITNILSLVAIFRSSQTK